MSTAAATRLSYRLDRELAWRKKELISIYLDIPPIDDGSHTPKCRSALLMLYAHWEGFVKFAFTAYIEEAASCVSDPRDYSDSLLGLSVRSWVLKVSSRRDSTELGRVLRNAMDTAVPLPRFRTPKLIRTKSNVGPKVLHEILSTVGLDQRRFVDYESTVIKPLVSSRNAIAHGSGDPVVVGRLRHFHHRVLDLFEEIRLYLEDSLSSLAYLN